MEKDSRIYPYIPVYTRKFGGFTHIMKLSEKQLEQALEMFAEGYSRPKIVSHFLEKDQVLSEQAEMDENRAREIRVTISEQLRSVDPSSSRFASSKYQELFDLHFQAKMDTIRNHYEMVINRSTTLMEHQIEKVTEQLQMLETAIGNAKVSTPETDKEYLSLLKMSDTLNQRLLDITDRLVERLGPDFQSNKRTKGSPYTQKE